MDNKENNQGDNVLFVGNGFDLHNGLKTKYTDYLDSLNQAIISKVTLKMLVESIEQINFQMVCDKGSQYIYTHNFYLFASGHLSLDNDDIEQLKQYYETEIKSEEKIQLYHNVNNIVDKLNNDDKRYLLFNCIHVISLPNTKVEYNENYCTVFNDDKFILSLDAKTYNVILVYLNKYTSYKNVTNKKESKYFPIDIPTLQSEFDPEIKPENIFEIYLDLLRNKIVNYDNDIIELNAGQNWIDVENILYENQFSHFRSKLRQHNDGYSTIKSDIEKIKNSLNLLDENDKLKYQEFIKIFYNDRTVLEDFNNFKERFAKYVEEEQKKIDIREVTKFYKKLDEKYGITRVYNFNYSNYLNDIVHTHNMNINTNTTIQNIHGDVTNGKDIVFGTNHYMFLEDLKQHNKYLENTNLTQYLSNEENEFKLTKMFQVMKIVGEKPQHSFNKVNSLTLLGHSIGNQDYEYIHSVIRTNPSDIKLNIIWTSWLDDKGEPKDNIEELTSGLYKMLGKYEHLYDDLSLHKMLLENRISFISIDDIYKIKRIEEEKQIEIK